jgi:hypothetical protein
MAGAVLLGELVGQMARLEVACRRCPRLGRLSVSRLVAVHGQAMPLPALARVLAEPCPRLAPSASIYDLCGVHFPGLVTLGRYSTGGVSGTPFQPGR